MSNTYGSVLTPILILIIVGVFAYAVLDLIRRKLAPVWRRWLWRIKTYQRVKRAKVTGRQALDVLLDDHDRSGR